MSRPRASLSLPAVAMLSAFASLSVQAADPGLAPWLVQMGASTAIVSAANWGKGQVLGVVDTGSVANHPVFAPGQVSASLSACAAVSFKCSSGVNDDNGHGTAVASIAAANRPTAGTYSYNGYTVQANSLIGVAPNANIVAEKVLNASGSGYSTDVANGINKAVAAGAGVINLSLTYMATPDIIAAINGAATKGVTIVWAGGNDSRALLANANTSGLTAAAIKRLVFAGALDTTAAHAAAFSNNAGTGSLISTTGANTSYASRWISAPGTSILAPGIQYGPNAMATWSGTSMAAPLVSGSLLLLQSAWPILKTNGTTADLLLGTATDLGVKGVDSTYGTGLVNLATAFQPVGALSVTLANGNSTPVSAISGSLLTSGALGNLMAIKERLANYMSFDSYQRNFTVNLSGLIQSRPTAASLNPLPTNVNSGVTTIKLSDGSEMSRLHLPTTTETERMGAFANSDRPQGSSPGCVALTSTAGTTMAMGYGVSSQLSFSRALYDDSKLVSMAGEMAVSNLSDLAQGGYHLVYGMRANPDTRLAFAFSRSASTFYPGKPAWGETGGSSAAANTHLLIGLMHKVNPDWTAGVSVGHLTEANGMLGSSYDANSVISMGTNRTTSLGLSLGYSLDTDHSLLAEAGVAFTAAGSSNGLLTGTTAIESRSFGVTFLSQRLFNQEDRLALSLKQPLRVVSGKASMIVPNIDEEGVAYYSKELVSLAPTGREVNFRMAYDTPINRNQSLSVQLGARREVMNIAGNNDAGIGATWSAKF